MQLTAFSVVSDDKAISASFDGEVLTVKGIQARYALALLELLSQGFPALAEYKIHASSVEEVVSAFRSKVAMTDPPPAEVVDAPPAPAADPPPRTRAANLGAVLLVDPATVGGVVRRLREGRKMSRATLAQAVGVSQTMIQLVERGDRRMRAELVERLAKVLGVPVEALTDATAPAPEGATPADAAIAAAVTAALSTPPEDAPPVVEPEPASEKTPIVLPDVVDPVDPERTSLDSAPTPMMPVDSCLMQGWALPPVEQWRKPAVYPQDLPPKWDRAQVRVHPVFGDAAVVYLAPSGKVGGFFYLRPPVFPDVGFRGAMASTGTEPMLGAPPVAPYSAFDSVYLVSARNFLQGVLYVMWTGANTRAQLWDIVSRQIRDKRGVFANYTQKLVYDEAGMRDVVFFVAEMLSIGHEEALRVEPGTYWERHPSMYLYASAHASLMPPSVAWPELPKDAAAQ